jgi:signal transduction histidine kinase
VQASVDSLSAIANAARGGYQVDATSLLDAIGPIRRDVARRVVLERDSAIGTAAGWSVFLAAEIIAALAVSAAAASALTKRWDRLRDGILRIRRGDSTEPFYTGVRDEFGAVEEELDGLIAALGDRERMRSELRALQGWGEASAFLAHQARTPLASLTLSARTAQTALETGTESTLEDARAALSRAGTEASRLASLFSRVRSLSGFKDPELVALDPEEAFREACSTLGARGRGIDAGDVNVTRTGSFQQPRFDRGYLVEAFINLLSNSLEACAERGVRFRAVLAMTATGDDFMMEFNDSVTGLDPAVAKRVGSARFTTKPDGAGLGVWLVGRIAALHGGRLEIGMTESGGLRFTMIFPVGGVT